MKTMDGDLRKMQMDHRTDVLRMPRPPVFKGRHFEPEIMVLCVRRYLRFSLSYRNLEELMAERNLAVDHVTIWR
jgi:hypothetical protein